MKVVIEIKKEKFAAKLSLHFLGPQFLFLLLYSGERERETKTGPLFQSVGTGTESSNDEYRIFLQNHKEHRIDRSRKLVL